MLRLEDIPVRKFKVNQSDNDDLGRIKISKIINDASRIDYRYVLNEKERILAILNPEQGSKEEEEMFKQISFHTPNLSPLQTNGSVSEEYELQKQAQVFMALNLIISESYRIVNNFLERTETLSIQDYPKFKRLLPFSIKIKNWDLLVEIFKINNLTVHDYERVSLLLLLADNNSPQVNTNYIPLTYLYHMAILKTDSTSKPSSLI